MIVDGRIQTQPVMVASLAADHRVSDGHRGALLLQRIAQYTRGYAMTPAELRAIIVAEIGNIAPEADTSNMREDPDLREALDLDSMDIFNIVVALSQRLHIVIPDADVPQLVTLGGGIAYLSRRLGS